jgi:hypothetical protein
LSLVWTFLFLSPGTTRMFHSPLSQFFASTMHSPALNPSRGTMNPTFPPHPPMLFLKSGWDLREYLLAVTLPEIGGVGMSEHGPLIVPPGHKSHANHLSTGPSPHRLLTSMYVWDYEMLRWAIRACTFRFHPPALALSHFISQSSTVMLPDMLLEPSMRTRCLERGSPSHAPLISSPTILLFPFPTRSASTSKSTRPTDSAKHHSIFDSNPPHQLRHMDSLFSCSDRRTHTSYHVSRNQGPQGWDELR